MRSSYYELVEIREDPSTEALGPQQRHDLLRYARHHHICMKIYFEDLHFMTEMKTCAGPALGPTSTHHPSHRATAIEEKGPLEAGFFRENVNTWCNS